MSQEAECSQAGEIQGNRGERRQLPARRSTTTQKVSIAGQRTVYLSVHDDPTPMEFFLRVKGRGCTSEVVSLYDSLARLASLALQYGVPLEEVAEMLHATKFAPAGPVTGHARIKFCESPTDYIGRHLLIEYCGREDLVHAHGEQA